MIVVLVRQDDTVDLGKVFEGEYAWRVNTILERMGMPKLLA
jgi:hypothetical protein